MADIVYEAETTSIALTAEFDTIVFPGAGAAFPASPIVITGFQPGSTGDRIDFSDWLEAITGRWSYPGNPFYSGFLKLAQDGDDTLVLVDLDGQIYWEGIDFVPWLRLEGVQMSALAAENFGYDLTPTEWGPPQKIATGTNAGELILGLDWNDDLDGGGGNDRIVGGRGFDSLSGGDGDDLVEGGAGGDQMDGGAGADRLEGGSGDDYLSGDAGDDLLLGGDGQDGLSDGDGNDQLEGGAGDDRLSSYSSGNDVLSGGDGDDDLYISRSSLFSVEQNRLEGGTGDDRITVDVQNRGLVEVDAGTGSDTVEIKLVHDRLTIRFDSDGIDTVLLDQFMGHWYSGASITLEGFGRGNSGGVIVWHDFLGRVLGGWNGSANPFAAGFARVATVDGRQILQIDPDGGANSWIRVIDLGADNGQVFTAFNFDGFDPGGAAALGRTLTGTPGPDDLSGHSGADIIGGLDEADKLYGRSGADSIAGGGGDDYVEGGPGADRIEGGDGDDFLQGGAGDDIVHGGAGNDRIEENMVVGAGGSDSLYGDGGDDFINFYRELPQPAGSHYFSGGDGDDVMLIALSNAGLAVIDGGAGDDLLSVSALRNGGGMVVTLGTGRDTLGMTQGRFQVASNSTLRVTDFAAGALGDRIDFGTSFSQWFTGWTQGANPFASGHLGLVPFAGGARLLIDSNGGANDFIILATLDGVNPAALTAENLGGWAPPVLAFTDGADQISGSAGTDLLAGLGGADVFRLYQGGDDAVLGGDGGDIFHFGAALTGADHIDGGDGVDTLVLQGPYGSLALSANVTQIENISILGGNNTSFGEPGTNRYDYVLTTHNANFAAGVQARINGAALLAGEDFTFNGSAETDASFVVYGGKGVDTLTGGFGNDIFIYAEERFAPGDTVNGGPGGYDGIFFRGNYTIDFNAAGYNGLMTSIENMTLTSITDERYARGGDAAGFDYNITLADNQLLAGVELTVSGVLLQSYETMIVDGSQELDGNFRLFGGRSDDTLKGGARNDLLLGNLGADTLSGGGGADVFRFDSTADSNSASMDHILDFTPGTDKIDLGRIDANTLVGGDQAFTVIGTNAFSGTAGELRGYEQGGTWYIEGDTNGDGVADLVIALTLQGPTPLGAGDFLL